MKLENKILLLVVGLVLVLGLLSFLVQRFVVYDRFVEIDYAEARQDVMRCVEAIRGEENYLAKLATDWAAWDDMYEYVNDRNERFVSTNLVSESFATLGVNLISISDAAGKPVWRHLRYKDKEYPLDSFPNITFTSRNGDIAHSRPRVTTGIIKIENMALVIAAVEIKKSNFGGPSRGVLVMGRVLDRGMMSQFGRQTKVEMGISWDAHATDPAGGDPKIERAGSSRFEGHYVLPVIGSSARLVINADIPVRYINLGRRVLWLSILLWFSIATALMLTLQTFVRKRIIMPLYKIVRFLPGITGRGSLSSRLDVLEESDEFALLSGEINCMIDRLEKDSRKREAAERETIASRKRYHDMIMGLPVGAYQHSRQDAGNIHLVNSSLLSILGCGSVGEFMRWVGDGAERRWLCRSEYTRLLEERGGVEGLELSMENRAGEKIDVRVWAHPMGPNIVEGIVIDYSSNKKAEAMIRRLAAVVDQAGEIIIITDTSYRIGYVNPSFERITGYHTDEVIGQTPAILKSGMHDLEFYRDIKQKIESGNQWSGQFINRKKNGDIYTEQGMIFPLFDEHGNITNFVGIKRDISKELKMEEQLRQAHKMEAIGTLAGGIAHDFNNILVAILGYSGLAQKEIPLSPGKAIEHINKVILAGERARDLVSQILTFSRRSQLTFSPVALCDVVEEALKLLRASLPSTVRIVTRLASAAKVLADVTQLHQVVINLCSNAGLAMAENGGTLTIGIDEVELTPEFMEANLISPVDGHCFVKLSVTDTGVGIAPDTLKRIFEPFFTTRPVGEGTGMGLAVVHGIVSSLNGAILVESELGKGTSFTVYLPEAAAGAATALPASDHQAEPLVETVTAESGDGRERILFVDDESILCELARETFGNFGFEVDTYEDSVKALEAFKAAPHAYGIVITDMTMPELRGDQLAMEIRKLNADIPVAICSGYSRNETEEDIRNNFRILHKPLVGEQLVGIVRELMKKR